MNLLELLSDPIERADGRVASIRAKVVKLDAKVAGLQARETEVKDALRLAVAEDEGDPEKLSSELVRIAQDLAACEMQREPLSEALSAAQEARDELAGKVERARLETEFAERRETMRTASARVAAALDELTQAITAAESARGMALLPWDGLSRWREKPGAPMPDEFSLYGEAKAAGERFLAASGPARPRVFSETVTVFALR